MDLTTTESLGIPDPGKWMPFFISLEHVYGAKLSSDDVDDMLFNCTTVFCYDGDTFVIDTPYKKFKEVFSNFKNQ